MYFPEKYFITEKRDGFVISELMKRAWAAQLEVLQRIIDVCEKHGLTYYAYWGTLLGAVRHKGYIPWDDDLDIAMKRDDYIRFLEIAKEELPKEYCVLNAYTEPEYENIFTRVTNRHAIDFSPEALKEYHGCPFVVGVDVFPLYYLSSNEEEANEQKMILELITAVSGLESTRISALENKDYELAEECQKEVIGGLVELQNITSYQFTSDRTIRNQLLILYDQISQLFLEEESVALTSFPQYLKKGYYVERELLEESLEFAFENMRINVPVGYDCILNKTYPNYMVPRRRKATHDYPFYKGQLELLGKYINGKVLAWNVEHYIKDEEVLDKESGCLLPAEWYEKLLHKDGRSGRKQVILYYGGAEGLIAHEEYVGEKLMNIFQKFKNSADAVLWWIPSLTDNPNTSFVKNMVPELMEKYEEMIRLYREEGWGIYDDSGNIDRAIAVADVYYGDESELLEFFLRKGKKIVLLQDYQMEDDWKQ